MEFLISYIKLTALDPFIYFLIENILFDFGLSKYVPKIVKRYLENLRMQLIWI